MMTHGPPLFSEADSYGLDKSQDGKHCGCARLARAIRRVKPRLHSFGHIHEGSGAMRMNWDSGQLTTAGKVSNEKPEVLEIGCGTKEKETLLINAAVQEGKAWLVDMEL